MGFFDFYVRVGVIETPTQVWKTRILPLNYTRISKMLTKIRRFGESSRK